MVTPTKTPKKKPEMITPQTYSKSDPTIKRSPPLSVTKTLKKNPKLLEGVKREINFKQFCERVCESGVQNTPTQAFLNK